MDIDSMRARIIADARASGCDVQPVRKTYRYEFCRMKATLRTRVYIDGKLCLLSILRAQPDGRPIGGFAKYHFSTLSSVDAVILRIALPGHPERTFVVPALALRDALFGDSAERLTKHLGVPVRAGDQRSERIDLWRYENAWHVLKQ